MKEEKIPLLKTSILRPAKRTNKLKPIQKDILNEYIDNGYNLAAAVRKYKPLLKPRSVYKYGQQLRNRDRAKEYIKRRHAALKVDADIQAHDITNELKAIAFHDITNYIGLDAEQLKTLTKTERRALKKVTTRTKEYITKGGQKIKESQTTIETHDKQTALLNLGKRIGYFLEDNRQKRPQINLTKIDTHTLNQVLHAIDTTQDRPPSEP